MENNQSFITHKFRLYPNKEQESLFNQNVGACRWLYNLFLERKMKLYKRSGKSPSGYDMVKTLPNLKEDFPWLKEVDASSLVQTVLNLDKAYKNFFRLLKSGDNRGFPKFKSRSKSNLSFAVVQNMAVDSVSRLVRISKHGWVKARGDFTSITSGTKIQRFVVYKDSDGNWYASALVKQLEPPPDHVHQYSACGVDVGVVKPLSVCIEKDDGSFSFATRGKQFSEDLKKKECRRKLYQRQYARKQNGSKNQEKARLKVGKAFYREKQFRKNWAEQMSYQLASSFKTVVFEDLKMSSMTRLVKKNEDGSPRKSVSAKTGLNRGLLRLGLSSLMNRTEQKARKFHGDVVYVNPRFTSQTCAVCGSIDKRSRKSQAVFECVDCGHTNNADYNAAENILCLGK